MKRYRHLIESIAWIAVPAAVAFGAGCVFIKPWWAPSHPLAMVGRYPSGWP